MRTRGGSLCCSLRGKPLLRMHPEATIPLNWFPGDVPAGSVGTDRLLVRGARATARFRSLRFSLRALGTAGNGLVRPRSGQPGDAAFARRFAGKKEKREMSKGCRCQPRP